jgi:putative ABC transport system ATP-binding protein
VTAEPVVLLEGVAKTYPGRGGGPVEALRVARWEVPALAQIAVTGDSGSGKSTLLHVLAGIVLPDRGRVSIHGTDIAVLPEAARDRFRGRSVGLVFQSLNLFRGVGLSGRAGHRPREMSLGEQQRVAIARALMNAPPLLLCDEPTGSLDARNRDEVVALLRTVAAEEKATLLVVTHDEAVVAAFPERVRVGDLAR